MFESRPSRPTVVSSQQETVSLERVDIPLGSQCFLKKVKSIKDGKEIIERKGDAYTVLMPETVRKGEVATFLSVSEKKSLFKITKISSIQKVGDAWLITTKHSVYQLSVDKIDPLREEKRVTVEVPETMSIGTFYAGPGKLIKKGYLIRDVPSRTVYQYGAHRGEDAVGIGPHVTVVCDGLGSFRGSAEFSRVLATKVREKITQTTANEDVQRILKEIISQFREEKMVDYAKRHGGVDVDLSFDQRHEGWYSTVSILIDRGTAKYDFFSVGDSPLYVYNTKENKIRVSYGDKTAGKKGTHAVGVSFTEEHNPPSFRLQHEPLSPKEHEVIIMASDFFSDNMAFEQHHEVEVARLTEKKKKGELLTKEEATQLSRLELELGLYKNYISCKPGEERELWIQEVLEKSNSKLADVFRCCSQKSIFTEFVTELMSEGSIDLEKFQKLSDKYSYLSKDDVTFVVVNPGKIKRV